MPGSSDTVYSQYLAGAGKGGVVPGVGSDRGGVVGRRIVTATAAGLASALGVALLVMQEEPHLGHLVPIALTAGALAAFAAWRASDHSG